MKYFVFFLILIFSSLFFLTSNPAFGWCPQNEDWSDRPCYTAYQDFGIEKEKSDWEPYYDFKGSEWMESKKQEMLQAIQNDALFDWIESTPETQAHRNVHEYYFLFGEVPNLDGKFVDEIELSSSSWDVDEYSTDVSIPISEEEPLIPEPLIPEPYYEPPVYDPSCGLGTTYKDGICIADETEEKTTSSYKWDGFEEEIPLGVLDCDVDQIYNKETQTCDVRLNSIDVLIPVLVAVLISGFVVFLIWRKRK